MANNNSIATLTTRVQISKQQAFEDFVKVYKDIQKEVDKDAIVYTLKADKSSLKDLLKQLKDANFEIGTDIVLNTKSNDLQSIIEELFSKATSNADLGLADRIKKELDDVESDIAKKRKRLDELSKAKSSSSDKKRTSSEVMDEIDKTVAYLKKSSTTEKAAERAAKYLMDLYAYMDKIGEKFPKKEEGIYRTIKENYKDFVPGYKGNADNAFNRGKTSANTDKIIKEQKQLLDSIQSLEDKRQELLDQLQSNTSSTVPISENEISATEEESRALDTLIDKIEYLKKIKSESKFMETAEEKLSDMEDKAWDAGGNNPKSEAESLKKIKAYEDLSEHIDKARDELDKFDESYEKVIITLKNGEQIEIFDSSDLEDLSLAKNKIQDIQFVTEELVNTISSGKKAFDKVNEIEEWSNANFDKQLFPPTVKYADSIDELQDVLLKIREFKQDLIDINNMDDGTITVARKDELLNTIDYLDTLQQSVQKTLDIKKQFEAERKSDSEEKWRNSLSTELYHLQEENSSLEMENDSLKSLLSKKDREGISVKDFYNTYGLPSEALDSNVFSNVREILDHLGGSFKEINEEAEDFSEIKLNARFLESLIEQLNLSKDELDVIKESLSSIYDIVPGGKYAYLSSPVNNSKQAWNELNKIQSIIEGTHKVSSEEIEHAREMIQLRNEASQIVNENQTISNDKSLRELVETLAELKASSSTSEDELNSVKDAIVDILNLDVSKFESFAKILLTLNSDNPLLTDGSRNVEQTVDALERLSKSYSDTDTAQNAVKAQVNALKEEQEQAEATAKAEDKVYESRNTTNSKVLSKDVLLEGKEITGELEVYEQFKDVLDIITEKINNKIASEHEEYQTVITEVPQEVAEFEKLNQKIQDIILSIASKISMVRQERSEVENAVQLELQALQQLVNQPDINIKIHAETVDLVNEIKDALANGKFDITLNPDIQLQSGGTTPPPSSPGKAPGGGGRKPPKGDIWDIVRQYRVDSKGRTYISDTFKNGNESIIQGFNGNVLRKNEKTSTAYSDQVKLQKKLYADQKSMINEVFRIKKQIYNLDKVENAEEVSELRNQLKELQSAINVTKKELRNNGVDKSDVDSKYNELYSKQQQSYDNWEKQQKAQTRDEKRQATTEARLEKQKQIYADELANRIEVLNIQHKLNMAQIEGTKEFKSMTDAEKKHLQDRKQELDLEYQSISKQRKGNANQTLRDTNDLQLTNLKEQQRLELQIAQEKAAIAQQEKADTEALTNQKKQAIDYDKQEADYLKKRNQYLAEGTKQQQEYEDSLEQEWRQEHQDRLDLDDAEALIAAKQQALAYEEQEKSAELERKQITEDAIKSNKEAAEAYDSLTKQAKEYYELSVKAHNGIATDFEKEQLDILEREWNDATNAVGKYKLSIDEPVSLKAYNTAQTNFENSISLANLKERESLIKDLKKYTNLANSADSKYMGEFASKIKEVRAFLQEVNDKGFDFADPASEQRLAKILQYKKEIESSQGLEKIKKASEETINKLQLKISDFMQKNSGMGKEFMSQFDNLRIKLDGSQSVDEVKAVLNEFIKLENEVTKADKLGKSFFKTIGEHWRSITAQWAAQYLSIQDLIRYARTAFETIHQLDTALVDLKKTTTMSNSELEDFYHNSSRIAKQMGVSSEEIISQASAWSRLGYSSKEAAESMAELSSQFAKISPGTSVEDATDYLVSTMKAFNIDVTNVESDIMDSINRIGNTMATSNQEVGEMLKRSSAAMAAANNSLAETIALESAAVQITRNAETTGINSAA